MRIVFEESDKAKALAIKNKSIKVGSVLLSGLLTLGGQAYEVGRETGKQIINELNR